MSKCTCTPDQFCECPSCQAQLALMNKTSTALCSLLEWVAADYGPGLLGNLVEDLMAAARNTQLSFDEIIAEVALTWSK